MRQTTCKMDTLEIIDSLACVPEFIGVFPRDKIPLPKKLPSAYVVNYDSSKEKGEHWIAIYLDKTRGEFFDPFGLPPLHPKLIKYMKTCCKKWVYSTKDIQHADSTSCGHFCIYYLKRRALGVTFEKILTDFDTSTLENDSIAHKSMNSCHTRLAR